jgi:uncharacterized membrane protein YgcG
MLRSTVLLAPALAALLTPAAARAVYPPPVKDDGKFFKPEALEKANKKIHEIYQKYRKDVVVQTIEALSPEEEKQLKDEGKAKFFEKFADKRAEDVGLNGVYVLFVKKPQHYQIVIDPETRKRAFTPADRRKLGEKIVEQFKAGNFDAGLLDGLDVVEASLKANAK